MMINNKRRTKLLQTLDITPDTEDDDEEVEDDLMFLKYAECNRLLWKWLIEENGVKHSPSHMMLYIRMGQP